ncbi:MAG: hypothetical protein WDN69_14160 [Aliidongia sp.]
MPVGQFPQPAIDFAPKGWLAVIETNLSGTWFMMQGRGAALARQERARFDRQYRNSD